MEQYQRVYAKMRNREYKPFFEHNHETAWPQVGRWFVEYGV